MPFNLFGKCHAPSIPFSDAFCAPISGTPVPTPSQLLARVGPTHRRREARSVDETDARNAACKLTPVGYNDVGLAADAMAQSPEAR
jgi:hypothetical protein